MDDVEPQAPSALGDCCLPVAPALLRWAAFLGQTLDSLHSSLFGGFWKRSSFLLFPMMLSGLALLVSFLFRPSRQWRF